MNASGYPAYVMRAARTTRAQAGVTLAETLVVLAVIVLCAWVATPVFVAWHARDQVDARANALLGSLAYARAQAIRLQARVSVCRTRDGRTCATSGVPCAAGMLGTSGTSGTSGATDWSCGWAVMVERGGAIDPAVSAGAGNNTNAMATMQPLRIQPALDAVGVTSKLFAVVFTPPAGQAIGSIGNFEIIPRISTTQTRGARWRRCIRIAAGGRARMTDGACSGAS